MRKLFEKDANAVGIILLIGAFDNGRYRFRQDSSFYYFSGITEPGSILIIDLCSQKTTLFIPQFEANRNQWVGKSIACSKEMAVALDIDCIEYLGKPYAGYTLVPNFCVDTYENVQKKIEACVNNKQTVYTLSYTDQGDVEKKYFCEKLLQNGSNVYRKDILDIVYDLRRSKEHIEIEHLFRAVKITEVAHEAAAKTIQPQAREQDVHAVIDYVFTSSGSHAAFPSIVASGKRATVLHYTENNNEINKGDLVIVDIGAEYNGYCADITRTYPASGKFTTRQRELYTLVLEVQEYIASIVKPGYWISNKEFPDQSLHHLAQNFLRKKGGYDKYFIHSIGHFLGLEVHDVGNSKKPLQEGDVITIEPGIYIPDENIGIRIEDNFWIIKDGSICLSEDLPRHPDAIEKMVTQTFILEDGEVSSNLKER